MFKKSHKGTPSKPRRANIASHTYDPEKGTLDVTFHSGRTYRYAGIPEAHGEILGGPTLSGKWLHKHIIGHCDCNEIKD